MKVVIVGKGGREHALAWRISKSPKVKQTYVIPGNGGTAAQNITNLPDITSKQDIVAFCIRECIDLVVIGPEHWLVEGLSDELKKYGIACFGPSQKAARLEGSKAFSKNFMSRYQIPTSRFKVSNELICKC
jgi:phosphoribosylamine-glycine ligase